MTERIALPLTVDPAAYDTDVHAWASAQAALLRARRFEEIDLDNIVQEIESLGREQAHAVQSHLIVLVEHLLKLSVSGDREPRRLWATSVRNARNRIAIRLRRNPSLRPQLAELLADGWQTARDNAAGGLRLDEEGRVPRDLPFTLTEVMDPIFWPGA